jgi:ketosteroid isomerase-like protein
LSEETFEGFIRGWLDALERKDIEKALSFIAEDAVWVTNEGTFKGKQEWRQYLTWMEEHEFAVEEFEDAGIGIMVKGNRAVSQYLLKGKIPNGMTFEVPGVCLFEFQDGKIQRHTTIFDRLSLAKQVAKGIAEKEMVHIVVKRAEKGLRSNT